MKEYVVMKGEIGKATQVWVPMASHIMRANDSAFHKTYCDSSEITRVK